MMILVLLEVNFFVGFELLRVGLVCVFFMGFFVCFFSCVGIVCLVLFRLLFDRCNWMFDVY